MLQADLASYSQPWDKYHADKDKYTDIIQVYKLCFFSECTIVSMWRHFVTSFPKLLPNLSAVNIDNSKYNLL